MKKKIEKDKMKLAHIYHNMGVLFQAGKDYAKAVDAYKMSLRNNPADDETRYNLALAQKMLKDQQQNKQNQDQNQDQNKDQQRHVPSCQTQSASVWHQEHSCTGGRRTLHSRAVGRYFIRYLAGSNLSRE